MEILLEEEVPRKSSPQTSSASSKRSAPAKKKVTVRRVRKESDSGDFDDLVSTATKKKVVKRVVKKVKKSPSTTESTTHTGILEPLGDFSLSVGGPTLPPPLSDDEEDSPPLPAASQGPNPFSFFQFDPNKDSPPPFHQNDNSPLPDLPSDDSDSEWGEDQAPSDLDMLLNLPDIGEPTEEQTPEPQTLGTNASWKERALHAERNAAVWQNKYLHQREQLKEAEKRIKKLKAKEKADAEQMDEVLRKVERNLQQSRTRYEERLGSMKSELSNAKRMIQHLTQSGEIEIPDNFEEYQEFIENGKTKALYASSQLHTLAENAESQVNSLLKGCAALKELSVILASVDMFSDQPQPPSM